MKTIAEVYKLMQAEYEKSTQDLAVSRIIFGKYSDMILEEIFKPLVQQAGMEWGKFVVNTFTNEIGMFECGQYNRLNDYIIFRPVDKNWVPKDVYKKVSTSTKNEMILKALKRDYVPYTGVVPDFNTDILPAGATAIKGYFKETEDYGDWDLSCLEKSILCDGRKDVFYKEVKNAKKKGYVKCIKVMKYFQDKKAMKSYVSELKEKFHSVSLREPALKMRGTETYEISAYYAENVFAGVYLNNY